MYVIDRQRFLHFVELHVCLLLLLCGDSQELTLPVSISVMSSCDSHVLQNVFCVFSVIQATNSSPSIPFHHIL